LEGQELSLAAEKQERGARENPANLESKTKSRSERMAYRCIYGDEAPDIEKMRYGGGRDKIGGKGDRTYLNESTSLPSAGEKKGGGGGGSRDWEKRDMRVPCWRGVKVLGRKRHGNEYPPVNSSDKEKKHVCTIIPKKKREKNLVEKRIREEEKSSVGTAISPMEVEI